MSAAVESTFLPSSAGRAHGVLASPALAAAEPFSATLAGAIESGRAPVPSEARSAAEKLVATVFVEPILERMRGEIFMADRFAAGSAEKRFGPLFDQTLADRIVSRPGFPLVEAVERHLRVLAGDLPASEAGGLR